MAKFVRALSVEFIYLAARLARQWMKERVIGCMVISVEFIHLSARLARLARQRKERGIVNMRVRANEQNKPARLVHG